MKRLCGFGVWGFLFLILSGGLFPAFSQVLIPGIKPQASMYDLPPDLYQGPPGIKVSEVFRYIPNTKTMVGLDVRIERMEYDEKGRLSRHCKYQNVTGERIYERRISYDARGRLLSDSTWGQKVEHQRFITGKPSPQHPEGLDYFDQTGTRLATWIPSEKGSIYTLMPDDSLAFVLFTYDHQHQLQSVFDARQKSTEIYSYDDRGELSGVRLEVPGYYHQTEYQSVYEEGLMVRQTELKNGQSNTVEFNYNPSGTCIQKLNDTGRPMEDYTYDGSGRLEALLFYNPGEFPSDIRHYCHHFIFLPEDHP